MNRIATILVTTFVCLSSTQSSAKQAISETFLLSEFRKAQTQTDKGIAAALSSLDVAQYGRDLGFAPIFFGQTSYGKSQQELLPNSFQAEDTYMANIGIKKKFEYGIESELSYQYLNLQLGDYQTQGQPEEVFVPKAKLSVNMSLWRNFLGRLDKLSDQSLEISKDLVHIKNSIQLSQVESQIRMMFWRYAQLQQIQKVNSQLLNASIKQQDQIKKRLRRGVADQADLGRSEATVLQRKYEENKINLQMMAIARDLISIMGAHSKIENYVVNASFDDPKIEQCSEYISKIKATPRELSQYSKLLTKLNKGYQIKRETMLSDKGNELFFQANITGNGQDLEYQPAQEESFHSSKANYEMLLGFTMQLGKSASRLSGAQVTEERLLLEKDSLELNSKMSAQHLYTVKALAEHKRNISFLERTMKAMSVSLKAQEEKFNQGRLDYINLIREQESLTSMKAQLITLKVDRVLTLISYFSVFNEVPCAFNLNKGVKNG